MPEYDASILLDGWVRVRIQADNQWAALAILKTVRPCITLRGSDHEQVGEVENPTIIYLDVEDITLVQPSACVEAEPSVPARPTSPT